MHTRFHFPFRNQVRLFTTFAVLLVLLLRVSSPAAAGVHKVYISNVRDGSFVVSWVTDTPSNGSIDWGATSALGNTAADGAADTTTHYVTISDLSPSTRYYFQVRSGSDLDNNGGAFYSVTTGPSLSLPEPGGTIWGELYRTGGSIRVPNAIVYIRILDQDGKGSPGYSQWATARTGSSGEWYCALSNIRTLDASAYFSFTNGQDQIQIVWQGGRWGSIGEIPKDIKAYAAPGSYPWQQDMNLDGVPTSLTLKSFVARTTATLPAEWLAAGGILLAAILVPALRFTKRRKN